MNEELLKALTTKFPGVSASSLSRIAAKLGKTATTAEQVKTAVDGVTIQQIIESYADSRATEASETAHKNAVTEYEKKYGLKDGVKLPDQKTEGGNQGGNQGGSQGGNQGGEETPAWAKGLIERLDRIEATRTTDTRRKQLDDIIGQLPDALKNAYNRLPVDKYTDEEFTKLVQEVTEEAKTAANAVNAKGGIFGRPSGGGNQGGGADKDLTEEQQKAIAQRTGGALKEGQQPF
jgi:hypothetical protein